MKRAYSDMLVRENLEELVDLEKFKEMKTKEEADKVKLSEMAENFKGES